MYFCKFTEEYRKQFLDISVILKPLISWDSGKHVKPDPVQSCLYIYGTSQSLCNVKRIKYNFQRQYSKIARCKLEDVQWGVIQVLVILNKSQGGLCSLTTAPLSAQSHVLVCKEKKGGGTREKRANCSLQIKNSVLNQGWTRVILWRDFLISKTRSVKEATKNTHKSFPALKHQHKKGGNGF